MTKESPVAATESQQYSKLPMVPVLHEHHLLPRAKQWSAKKRFGLFGALTLGLGIALFITPDESKFLWAVAGLPFSLSILLYIVFSSYRWNKESKRGEEMLQVRQFQEAVISFDDDCRTHRGSVGQHAQSLLNLAVATLFGGDHGRALAILAATEQYPGIKGWASTYERIPGWMAYAYALQGDIAAAKAWLKEGETRCDSVSGILCILGQAVVSCRQNDPKAAAELLTRDWSQSEIALVIFALPDLRVLRAFALKAQGKSRNDEEAETLLQGARGAVRGSYDYLATHWPEMSQFIEVQRLY